MVQTLQSLSYKEYSIILPKFTAFGSFILILGTSAIMNQTACCHVVTTSETGLYSERKSKGITCAITVASRQSICGDLDS